MKNIFRIVKKELDKIFKFPRTVFTTLLLPGLVLFIIYAIIGSGFNTLSSTSEKQNSFIYVINSPESLQTVYEQTKSFNVDLIKANKDELEELKQKVINGEIAAILLYDEDFDENIGKEPLPKIKILFDSSSNYASTILQRAQTVIIIHQEIIYQDLGINPHVFELSEEKIEPKEKGAAAILAMILPMLIISFIFASALGIGSDAIAGEKERGTLATLLMLPIKRSEIIIGKIISTSILTLLSALSSFVGLIASLPFSKSMFPVEGNISYGFFDISTLIIILFLIALLASTMLLIISTLAKNIKEATTMSMPIYITALIIPMISMFSTNNVESKIYYIVPLYNTILGLKEILSFNFDLVNFIIILSSSLIYISVFILFLIKLFRNERILYSK